MPEVLALVGNLVGAAGRQEAVEVPHLHAAQEIPVDQDAHNPVSLPVIKSEIDRLVKL